MGLLPLLVGLVSAQVGCTKDTDCKGERVCEAGRCVNPAPSGAPVVAEPAPSPPPLPQPPPPRVDPSDYPKVVRRDGQVCVQSLNDDGTVGESCRAEAGARRPLGDGTSGPSSSWDEPVPPRRTKRGRKMEGDDAPQKERGFAADFAVLGGVTGFFSAGQSFGLPLVDLHLSFGGRFSRAIGLSGVIDTKFFFGPGGWGTLLTFGPGVRLGPEAHVTIAATGGFVFGATSQGTAFGYVVSLLAHVAIPFASGFGFHLQPALSFDASGVVLSLGGGFGGSVF